MERVPFAEVKGVKATGLGSAGGTDGEKEVGEEEEEEKDL